jgi:hypothetical protein
MLSRAPAQNAIRAGPPVSVGPWLT